MVKLCVSSLNTGQKYEQGICPKKIRIHYKLWCNCVCYNNQTWKSWVSWQTNFVYGNFSYSKATK